MIKNIFGFFCIILAVIFCFLETKYFGNNWLPNTPQEFLCDLVSLILLLSGYFLINFKTQNYERK